MHRDKKCWREQGDMGDFITSRIRTSGGACIVPADGELGNLELSKEWAQRPKMSNETSTPRVDVRT